MSNEIKYKYNEKEIMTEVMEYIDSTYGEHYSGEIQATEGIIAVGHGLGFTIGNILKYAWRLGRKGGFNEKDLDKIIHYAVVAIFVIRKYKKEGRIKND